MSRKAKKGTDMGKNSSKWEAAVLRARRKMKKEMDRAWKAFFEKNPGINAEVVQRRVEERSRSSKQNQ